MDAMKQASEIVHSQSVLSWSMRQRAIWHASFQAQVKINRREKQAPKH